MMVPSRDPRKVNSKDHGVAAFRFGVHTGDDRLPATPLLATLNLPSGSLLSGMPRYWP